MKYSKQSILLIFLCLSAILLGQEETETIKDSLYREDQVYLGVTFNLLTARPDGVSQNGFSGGVQAGVIRDFPINKNRNKAIGLGLGLAFDIFNHNLFIGEEEDGVTTIYDIIDDDVAINRNRFTYYSLELPIEYRWRTSTAADYDFWRIYGGIRLGYIYFFRSVFDQANNEVLQTDIPELNRFQYGLSLSVGYDAFNFQAYYGLNTLFNDDAQLNENAIDLQVLRLGIQFYFL